MSPRNQVLVDREHVVPQRVVDRFLDSLEYRGCLESTYAPMTSGYSQMGWGPGQHVYGHRLMWALVNGPIPEDMTVHHRCFNRACVLPDHLRLLSNFENARRSSSADWEETGVCKRGHPDSERVRRTHGAGKRVTTECRACRLEKYAPRVPQSAPCRCHNCGAEFTSYRPHRARWCSKRCENRWRRSQEVA